MKIKFTVHKPLFLKTTNRNLDTKIWKNILSSYETKEISEHADN